MYDAVARTLADDCESPVELPKDNLEVSVDRKLLPSESVSRKPKYPGKCFATRLGQSLLPNSIMS